MATNETIKRCPRCTAAYLGEHCTVCMSFLQRAEHPRKLIPREIRREVESWKGCTPKNMPVDAKLWAQRMGVILNRDIGSGDIVHIHALIDEVTARYPSGGSKKRR